MSITRIQSWLTAWIAVLALAPPLQAQLFHPFAFPEVTTDFQFFAPVNVDDFGGGAPFRTGWFATFDRVYMSVSRPEGFSDGLSPFYSGFFSGGEFAVPLTGNYSDGLSETYGDFTWGNRFDLGYVDEEGKGWLFTGWHINGPNEDRGFVWTRDPATNQWIWLRAERINRFNDETGEIVPIQDRNNFYTGARDFIMHQSLNIGDLSGFELNKLFRLEPLHHNSVLEPFFGFRYAKFIDMFRRMRYERFDENGFPVPVLPIGIPLEDPVFEELSQDFASFTNHLVGGQLGIRWFKRKGHWQLSSQFRMFAAQNFQEFDFQRDSIVTEYDGDDVASERNERFNDSAHRQEFVLMGEARAEAAYYLTRDIAFQMGVEVMHFGFGVARGDNPNRNDEDLTLVGATFGFTFNR